MEDNNKVPTTIPVDRGKLTQQEKDDGFIIRNDRKYTLGGVLIPKDGRFSAFYQPIHERSWTLEKAMDLGRDLLLWLEHEDNVFFLEYLSTVQMLCRNTINYLEKKYEPFKDLMMVARAVQESKLVGGGLNKKLHSQVVNFVLANKHGYKDQRKVDSGVDITITASNDEHKDIIEDILKGDD